jgi:hypothetical protein
VRRKPYPTVDDERHGAPYRDHASLAILHHGPVLISPLPLKLVHERLIDKVVLPMWNVRIVSCVPGSPSTGRQ